MSAFSSSFLKRKLKRFSCGMLVCPGPTLETSGSFATSHTMCVGVGMTIHAPHTEVQQCRYALQEHHI